MIAPALVAALDPTLILVALIGSVPATIAAIGSVKSARRTRTTNGSNLGQLAERIEHKLDTHIANQKLHRAATEDAPPEL